MNMPTSPQELVDLFNRVAPTGHNIVAKRMFGFPALFVNGNMASGLHGEDLMVRLSPEDRSNLLQEEGAHLFEPMPGRPMKEYVVLPKTKLSDEKALNHWMGKAISFAASLPPKEKKAPKGKG